jgi:hypothetical protein
VVGKKRCVHYTVPKQQPLVIRGYNTTTTIVVVTHRFTTPPPGWGGGTRVTAVIAWGKRPVPYRTRKLRPTAPMVLHSGGCGRVGHRRTQLSRNPRTPPCSGVPLLNPNPTRRTAPGPGVSLLNTPPPQTRSHCSDCMAKATGQVPNDDGGGVLLAESQGLEPNGDHHRSWQWRRAAGVVVFAGADNRRTATTAGLGQGTTMVHSLLASYANRGWRAMP